jgi:hypothetical protein
LGSFKSRGNNSFKCHSLAGCTGNILGQIKNKRMALSALKAAVDAGTADVHDIVNFDCTINIPSAVITDKY